MAKHIAEETKEIPFDTIHPNDAVRRMKQALQNSAQRTLMAVMSKQATTNEAKVQALFQLARALASGDVRAARQATRTFPPLATCVKIQHACVVLTQLEALEGVAVTAIRTDLAARARE